MNKKYEDLLKENNVIDIIQKDIDRTSEAQSILECVPYFNEALKSYSIAKDGIDYDNLDHYTKKSFDQIQNNLISGIENAENMAFDVFKESIGVYIEHKKDSEELCIYLTEWINTFENNQVNPKKIIRHALKYYSNDEDIKREINYNVGIAFKTNYTNSSDYSYKEFTDTLKNLSIGNDKAKELHNDIFWNTYNLQKEQSSDNHLEYFIKENSYYSNTIIDKISDMKKEHKQYVIAGAVKRVNEMSNRHQKGEGVLDLAKNITKKIFDTGYFDEIISKGIEREGFTNYISRQEGSVSTAFKGLINQGASLIKEGFDQRQKDISNPEIKKTKSFKL